MENEDFLELYTAAYGEFGQELADEIANLCLKYEKFEAWFMGTAEIMHLVEDLGFLEVVRQERNKRRAKNERK